MVSDKVLNSMEYSKILEICSNFAVLDGSKQAILREKPVSSIEEAEFLLKKTQESFKLLFEYGISGIEYFDPITDELARAKRESVLTMGELLSVARILRSARIVYSSITSIHDEEITAIRTLAESIYFDKYFEDDIFSKILSDEQMSDNASEKLYSVRRKIKRLNEQIRDKLNYYVKSKNKYLQDSIVTLRGDRYVIPVKAEFKGQVKGLIHDQSSSGSTIFIEPVEVLEMNNDLKTAMLEEKIEIERILTELTVKTGQIADRISNNIQVLFDIDTAFAKAIYAYRTKAVKPVLNQNGYVNIISGRHPLIDANTVVPVNITFGSKYKYLLITGPNTGGKTVSLKLVGLFCAMSASGFFIQASIGTAIAVFENLFVDIGDEQSIEQSLSTFSSHLKNIINITENVNERSLVLIDEIGAGTDPEEGAALARAVIEFLLEKQSFGIITTHYSVLKEYAFTVPEMMNASMDFNEETFAPLYRLNLGMAGSSNALKIATKLGLSQEIINRATSFLSNKKISFEKVLAEAEKTRRDAEKQLEEYDIVTKERQAELDALLNERAKFDKEREKFFATAKIESRRIVNEAVAEAEELVEQIKAILDKDIFDSGDLIKARTLKNKLEENKYKIEAEQSPIFSEKPIDVEKIKVGDRVFIPSLDANGIIVTINKKKSECGVSVGDKRVVLTFDRIYQPKKEKKEKDAGFSFTVDRSNFTAPSTQINVIGKTVPEALSEISVFLDRACLSNLNEVKIIHGVGLKILSSAIHDFLRKHSRVETFRFGKYGEGEHGVTFVSLK